MRPKHIVLHCGGMPFNGESVKTQSLGGSETAAYHLARELADMGHEVKMFTSHPEGGKWDGVTYISAGEATRETPLGRAFHFYVENTPHDVCIVQRHPQAFVHPTAGKVNYWWLHDLALIRNAGAVTSQMWNIDGVLVVSEFHKQQVCEIYDLDPGRVHVINNGVDLSVYEECKPLVMQEGDDKLHLLYQSRPERGLEHLVRPGGIMDRLRDEPVHLHVCGYDNTVPQMRQYYEHLWARCEELPNVTNHGALGKRDLALLQLSIDVFCYPTEFEEVSCITAMESMAAGKLFLSSDHAALPETCEGTDAVLLPLKDGKADEDAFVKTLKSMSSDWLRQNGHWFKLGAEGHRRARAKEYSWSMVAARVEALMHDEFCSAKYSAASIVRDMMRKSDIHVLRRYVDEHRGGGDPIVERTKRELLDCYDFEDDLKGHYERYYQYEKERGVEYGPEDLAHNDRFRTVAGWVADHVAHGGGDLVVLDYGCAHGHYTINLARAFPEVRFIGVDIAQSNIDTARKWAADEGVENVTFGCGTAHDLGSALDGGQASLILAAEVLEHVPDPLGMIEDLCEHLRPGGTFLATTPYGPWEYQAVERHHPWRAHLWHFDRADIEEMIAPVVKVHVVPAGHSKFSTVIGSFVWGFQRPDDGSPVTTGYHYIKGKIDEYRPDRETVSLCMIVKDAESTLRRTLESVRGVVDEVRIYVDPATTDDTVGVIDRFAGEREFPWPVISRHSLTDTALSLGFDAARNESIAEAAGDWVMWIDADEIVNYPEQLQLYLRPNQWAGYALKQHHFSAEPLGVLQTDLPCKLFRNGRGTRFFGVVHEHPEAELNEGLKAWLIDAGCEVIHQGYTNEQVRRRRFDRNLDLMARDRAKYPERKLGKFLWLRDLSHMNRYEMEHTNGTVTPAMVERAREGLRMFDQLLDDGELRWCVQSLDYRNHLRSMIEPTFGIGFCAEGSLDGNIDFDQANRYVLMVSSVDEAVGLFKAFAEEKVKHYGSRYL